MSYPYIPPVAGTFYVPPQWAEFVAHIPPIMGDFAQGKRNHLLFLDVVSTPRVDA